MVKVLHTADLHLDSPFSLEDPGTSEERKRELRSAFSDMMRFVRENGVQLLLMAGDVFENEFATKETVELLVTEFERTPDCRIVISPGNHDPYTENGVYRKTVMPDNVYIFDSEAPAEFVFPEIDVSVCGYAFTSKVLEHCPAIGARPNTASSINILCAHADTASPISIYAPITEKDIADGGFDYVALGHIHNGTEPKRVGSTYYAYSGCLEGRDYGESGYKGAVLCEFSKELGVLNANFKKVRFSRRRYAAHTLNVTGAAEISDIATAVEELMAGEGYGEDTLLRVTLEGNVPSGLIISQKSIKDRLPALFSFELVDNTVPLYDFEQLKADRSIRGALLMRLMPDLTEGDAESRKTAALALRLALAAIDGQSLSE